MQVTTRILDAAGAELLVDNSLLNGIMPGQRMAVGRTLVEPIAGPTQLDVTRRGRRRGCRPAAGPATSPPRRRVTEPEPNGGAVTRFAVRSGWPTDEEGVDVAAVYRAADGQLLAAETTTLDLLPAGGIVVGPDPAAGPDPGPRQPPRCWWAGASPPRSTG